MLGNGFGEAGAMFVDYITFLAKLLGLAGDFFSILKKHPISGHPPLRTFQPLRDR